MIRPSLVCRHLDIVDLVALLAHRHQVLGASLDPAHRATELARQMADQHRLAMDRRLDAEAAALIARRDHPNLGLGNAQEIGQRQLLDVRPLGSNPSLEPVALCPHRDRAARLERRDAGAVHAKPLANDHVRGPDQSLDLRGVVGPVLLSGAAGQRHREDLVVRPVVVDLRGRRGERALGIEHRRQRLIVDDNGFGGVLGQIGIGGHDRGDRRAMELDLVDGEWPERRVPRRHVGDEHGLRKRQHRSLEVGGRHHPHHAGHRQRGRGIDVGDSRMSVGAAHKGQVQHAGNSDVGEILAMPGHQPVVFLTAVTPADPARCGFGVRHPSPVIPRPTVSATHARRCCLDRRDDMDVPRAAADVANECAPYLSLARIRVVL